MVVRKRWLALAAAVISWLSSFLTSYTSAIN